MLAVNLLTLKYKQFKNLVPLSRISAVDLTRCVMKRTPKTLKTWTPRLEGWLACVKWQIKLWRLSPRRMTLMILNSRLEQVRNHLTNLMMQTRLEQVCHRWAGQTTWITRPCNRILCWRRKLTKNCNSHLSQPKKEVNRLVLGWKS